MSDLDKYYCQATGITEDEFEFAIEFYRESYGYALARVYWELGYSPESLGRKLVDQLEKGLSKIQRLFNQ